MSCLHRSGTDCVNHICVISVSTVLYYVNCVICVNRVNRTTINNIDSRPTRSSFHVCTLPLLARLTSCSTYGLLRQKATLGCRQTGKGSGTGNTSGESNVFSFIQILHIIPFQPNMISSEKSVGTLTLMKAILSFLQ